MDKDHHNHLLAMQKAFNEGFVYDFTFEEGELVCPLVSCKTYLISDVQHDVIPCPTLLGNLYKVETQDGVKGTFFITWNDNDE